MANVTGAAGEAWTEVYSVPFNGIVKLISGSPKAIGCVGTSIPSDGDVGFTIDRKGVDVVVLGGERLYLRSYRGAVEITLIPNKVKSDSQLSPPQRTAFGELKVESMTPITQITANYGLLNNVLTVSDSGESGINSIVNNKFTCDSGTSPTGLASILTLRQLTYRAGQGAMARFTAIFDPGMTGNLQAAGLITAENAFVFGYIGEDFGIAYLHDGIDELQELTLTAPASSAETAAIDIDGVTYSVNLSGVGTVEGDAFEISESLNIQVPNHNFTSNGADVVSQAVITGPHGAFAYSSATSAGAWIQISVGADPVQDFIPQGQWNVDTRISADQKINLDHQMGNVYQIQFQYLGFGAISFYVEDSASGDFVLVHRIQFANVNTEPSVTNPTFRVGWLSRNVGSTVSARVQGSSAGAFVEGLVVRDTPPRSDQNDQPGIGTALTNILSVRNRVSFGGKVNRAEIFPLIMSASSQTNKAAFFEVLINPTYAEPVIFNYVDKAGSLAEYSKSNAEVTGGQQIASITVVDGAPQTLRFNESNVTPIFPGATVCIAAKMSGGAAADCQATSTWQEDL